MAEEKKITTGYIGNALRSSAADHTTTFADEIFDTERQKYQNEVNTDLEQAIAEEKSAIMGTDRIADGAVTGDKIATGTINNFEYALLLSQKPELNTVEGTFTVKAGTTIISSRTSNRQITLSEDIVFNKPGTYDSAYCILNTSTLETRVIRVNNFLIINDEETVLALVRFINSVIKGLFNSGYLLNGKSVTLIPNIDYKEYIDEQIAHMTTADEQLNTAIDEVDSKVSDLREITVYCGSSSKNLFNRFDSAYNGQGCYINPESGAVKFSGGNNKISHLIWLNTTENSAITVSSSNQMYPVYGYRFFDKDFKIINFGAFDGTVSKTLQIPENAMYFQFSYSKNFYNIQVEYGDTATAYEEYNSEYEQKIEEVKEPIVNINTRIENLENTDGAYCGSSSKNLFNRFDSAYNGQGCYINPESGAVRIFGGDANKISHLIWLNTTENSAITVSSSNAINPVYGYRFFDKDFKIINFGAFDGTVSKTLQIPENAVYFQFSYNKKYYNIQVEYGDTATAYEEYNSEYEQKIKEVKELIENINTRNKNLEPYLKATADSVSLNNNLEISNVPNLKTWHSVSFRANIETFGKIRISHGEQNYTGGIVEIDNTNIYTYRYPDLALQSAIPHELTFKDYITVNIKIDDEIHSANLIITTNGGYFKEKIPWNGCRYNVIAKELEGGEYKSAVLAIGGVGLMKDIWIFGDSYADGWPVPMHSIYNFSNYMIDAYAGRNSATAYSSLINDLKIGTPKFLVWMMGMNDADSDESVNSSWLSTFNNLKDLCKNNGIILIPCTIPNVPERNMVFKNDIIKKSDLPYIDIAESLGASSKYSTWFEGLLGEDMVHPSDLGRKTIAEVLYTEFSLIQG